MKKFTLLAAAAAVMLLTPAMLAPAAAETNINVRIGTPGYHDGYRAYGSTRTKTIVRGPNCRMVTVRTKRANGTVLVRKVRRCG